MPKRSNPSTKIDKEKEVKKARTDDTAPINSVGFFGKLFGYRPATSDAPPLTIAVANGKKKTPTSSSSRKEEVKSTKSNAAGSSSVGSNTLLKSLRDNAAAKKSQTSTNVTTKTKAKNTTNRDAKTELPVVPFPHLPLTESQNKKSLTKSTLLLVILAILNITSAVYIGILYSNNNIHQFKYQMEINKLHDELTASQQEVDILRYRMNVLEDVVDEKEKLMSKNEDGEEEKMEMLTIEERKAFIEEIKLLENQRQEVMDEFNKNLSAF